ncbi:MAG TPA: HAD family hydrolase [Terracidiphilus sp.]|nr:HAD family hydrolase [Terracidiphilus sp.]
MSQWNDVQTVFLDRDGVLNEKAPEGQYVFQWQDFRVLDGVPEAIALLNRAGKRVIVVTNQRGVALGLYTVADIEALYAKFAQFLEQNGARIDAFYICPHDRGECTCRKPLPGLFEQAKADFPEISATESIMIGDSLVDMEFGRQLGMKTIFVAGAAEHQAPGAEKAAGLADLQCPSLLEAVKILIGST